METHITEELREYNRIYKESNELYHGIAKRKGLSDSAFDILYALYVLGDGCQQKDICGYSGTSKQTIHSSVRKLEREGILRLEPGPGRGVRVYPTAQGRALMERKIAPVAAAESRAFLCLNEEERQTFLRLARMYTAALQKECRDL